MDYLGLMHRASHRPHFHAQAISVSISFLHVSDISASGWGMAGVMDQGGCKMSGQAWLDGRDAKKRVKTRTFPPFFFVYWL